MPMILTSRTPWRRRPSGLVEIDRSSPQASGVMLAALADPSGWVVVSGQRQTQVESTMSIDAQHGVVRSWAGTAEDDIIPLAGMSGRTEWSISMWLRDTYAIGNSYGAWVGGNTAYDQSFLIGRNNGPTTCQIYTGNTQAISTSATPNGVWWLLTFTQKVGAATLYANGVVLATGTGAALGTFTAMQMGGNSATSLYSGVTIARVEVWNRALTAAEVYALYAPETRWSLYAPLVSRRYFDLGGGGGSTFVPQVIMVL